MFSFKHRITGPELNSVLTALNPIYGTEFSLKYADRYTNAAAAIRQIADTETRKDLSAKFEELHYAFEQVVAVRNRQTLDNRTLDAIGAKRDSMLRSIVDYINRYDVRPTSYEVPSVIKTVLTLPKTITDKYTGDGGVSVSVDCDPDGETQQIEIEEVNEYAPTPVIVKHLDGAEEALERFSTFREKLLKPTTRDYRVGKFPLIVMLEPFLSTEDLAKLGFETETMSIYQVFHDQRVVAVRKPIKKKRFADVKDSLIQELTTLMTKQKLQGKALMELREDHKAFWAKYERVTSKFKAALADATKDLNAALAGKEKVRKQRDALKKSLDKLAASLAKDGKNKNSPEYRKHRAKENDLNLSDAYWDKQLAEAQAAKDVVVAKLAKADERAEGYYTMEALEDGIAHHRKLWEAHMASRNLVRADQLDDNARAVWAHINKVMESLEDTVDTGDLLAQALQDLNAKEIAAYTGKQWTLVSEAPVQYQGTEFEYYWVMEKKQYMRLINGNTSSRARQTSYTKITDWGFAF